VISKKKKKSKSYYKTQSALAILRHKLVDGCPTHRLTHYMHKKDELPVEVMELCRSGEIVYDVDQLLDELEAQGTLMDRLEGWSGVLEKISEIREVFRGSSSSIRDALSGLLVEKNNS
jgi:hypothetical protein